MDCAKCDHLESFVNETLCGCDQNRCVKKPCQEPKRPSTPKPCHVITNKTDDCNCLAYIQETGPYCEPINEKAKNAVCEEKDYPQKCLENKITGTDSCGCDTNECVRLTQKPVDMYKDDDCPKNHFMTNGLTQCGHERNMCVKCPELKPCDLKCNGVYESSDVRGCPTRTCMKNPCKECPIGYVSEEDECGCKKCLPVPKSPGAQILLQRRSNVNVPMAWTWEQYKNGHSDSNGAFWAGLEMIYRLTSTAPKGAYQLMLKGKRERDGFWMEVVFADFYLDAGKDGYKIHYGNLVVNKGATVSQANINYMKGQSFSTTDRGNTGCVTGHGGGWWHKGCYHICLNCDQTLWKTGIWNYQKQERLTETEMALRIK